VTDDGGEDGRVKAFLFDALRFALVAITIVLES